MSGTRTDVAALVACCSATAFSDLTFALSAPFFPNAAAAHSLSPGTIGLIFATQPLCVMIGALGSPMVIERAGPFVVLRMATFAQSVFTLGFGLTDLLFTGRLPFLVACIMLRAAQGLACGLTETSAASLAMRSVPEHRITSAVGGVSAARALGVVLGPPIGGVGFDRMGFVAPFALASGLLLFLALAMLVLPVSPAGILPSAQPNAPTWSLLKVAPVRVALLCMWLVHCSITFLAPTLQPFLAGSPFYMSSSFIGLSFMLCTFAFAITAALGGVISDAIGHARQMMGGLAFIAAGYTIIGPSPLLWRLFPPLEQSTGLALLALCLASMGGGLAMVPASPLMVLGAMRAGFGSQESMDGVAALATLAGSFGGFCGSIVGGLFVEYMAFPAAAATFAALPILLIPSLCPFRAKAPASQLV